MGAARPINRPLLVSTHSLMVCTHTAVGNTSCSACRLSQKRVDNAQAGFVPFQNSKQPSLAPVLFPPYPSSFLLFPPPSHGEKRVRSQNLGATITVAPNGEDMTFFEDGVMTRHQVHAQTTRAVRTRCGPGKTVTGQVDPPGAMAGSPSTVSLIPSTCTAPAIGILHGHRGAVSVSMTTFFPRSELNVVYTCAYPGPTADRLETKTWAI